MPAQCDCDTYHTNIVIIAGLGTEGTDKRVHFSQRRERAVSHHSERFQCLDVPPVLPVPKQEIKIISDG